MTTTHTSLKSFNSPPVNFVDAMSLMQNFQQRREEETMAGTKEKKKKNFFPSIDFLSTVEKRIFHFALLCNFGSSLSSWQRETLPFLFY